MRRQKNFWVGPVGEANSLRLPGTYSDAKRPIKITGAQRHAIMAKRGDPVSCAMANAIMDNKDQFPHPVVMAFVTKSSAYIVTKQRRDGKFAAVRYGHNFGTSVDMNDTGELRKNPQVMEREFTLLIPRDRRGLIRSDSRSHDRKGDPRAPNAPWGTFRRAVKAGLITLGVAKVLQHGL